MDDVTPHADLAVGANDSQSSYILVVNDRRAARHLRRAGYVVREAPSGTAALRALEREQADLIVSQVDLPDMTGVEVCHQIRSRPGASRIPIIEVSHGGHGADLRVDVLESGADAVLTQPYEPAELLGHVRALLRARQAEQDLLRLNTQLEQRINEQTAEIRRAYDLLNGLLGGTTDKIAARDTELRFIAFNRAYRDEYKKVFGTDIEIGMGLQESLGHIPEDQKTAVELWKRALGGESFTLEHEFGDPGRQRNFYEFTFFPIRDPHGRIIGAGHIARDVSRRYDAEEALREANRRLEERVAELELLSYSISHDMRSPLRAMNGFAEALLEDYGTALDERGREYLHRIRRAGLRQDRLIQDVLTYTRVIREPIRLEPVDLHRLINEVLLHYANLQPPHMTTEIKEPLQSVLGHDVLLTQCLSNLLGNAAKFIRPGTNAHATVWTEAIGNRVRLWVADKGIGIAPSNQSRIFDLFQRLHPDHEFEGTGVGLAVVRKAVERMGGQVGVEAVLGQGSRFWIELPAA